MLSFFFIYSTASFASIKKKPHLVRRRALSSSASGFFIALLPGMLCGDSSLWLTFTSALRALPLCAVDLWPMAHGLLDYQRLLAGVKYGTAHAVGVIPTFKNTFM